MVFAVSFRVISEQSLLRSLKHIEAFVYIDPSGEPVLVEEELMLQDLRCFGGIRVKA